MTETDTKEDDTLHYPKGLSYSREREMLYVVSSSLVQTVDKEKKIKILCRSEFTLSSAFLAGDFLLISYKHGVNVIDLYTSDTIKIGTGNSSGLANGRFNIARFCNPHGLVVVRSEEHTSELQSHSDLVCRLLLEKKKKLYSPFCLSCYFISKVSIPYSFHFV